MIKTRIFLCSIFTALLFTACEKDSIEKSENEDIEVVEDDNDYTWSASSAIEINLNGTSISCSSSKVNIADNKATITSAGQYLISGTLTDGQIQVNTSDEGSVKLILNGITMSCSKSAPLYVVNAEKAVIIAVENTTNTITDASTYTYASGEDEPNAAIFSKADLIIYGDGQLVVHGNYNDAISSKDGLIIKNTPITVQATDDGIRGKDYLYLDNPVLNVTAGGDGLKSDNEDNTSAGFITITSGKIIITSGGDGISAITNVNITDGVFNIKTGGGSNYSVSSTSAKGIKAGDSLNISCETMIINSADDAIHSDGNLAINSGTYTISTADDGIHAEQSANIEEGDITISKSYEGIEGVTITINGGNIHITASDDGINAAGGSTVSTQYGNTTSGNMFINGGYVVVNSTGDGVDVNGSITMTAGTVIVQGPTNSGNGAIDYDGTFKVTGGCVIAAGSSGMAQAPSTSSTQYSLLINLSSAQQAGVLICIQKSDGTNLICFKPTKNYQSIAFSSSLLENGKSYNVYLGGSNSGTLTDGVYEGGTYTTGTKYTSFTISSIVTTIGNNGGRP